MHILSNNIIVAILLVIGLIPIGIYRITTWREATVTCLFYGVLYLLYRRNKISKSSIEVAIGIACFFIFLKAVNSATATIVINLLFIVLLITWILKRIVSRDISFAKSFLDVSILATVFLFSVVSIKLYFMGYNTDGIKNLLFILLLMEGSVVYFIIRSDLSKLNVGVLSGLLCASIFLMLIITGTRGIFSFYYYNKASAYLADNKFENAEKYLIRSRDLNPLSEDASKELIKIYQQVSAENYIAMSNRAILNYVMMPKLDQLPYLLLQPIF